MVNSLTCPQRRFKPFNKLRALGRNHLAAVVVASGALVAAACGGSSGTSSTSTTTTAGPPLAVATVEKAIQQTIQKQHGVTTVVTCPAGVPRESGYQFVCTASLDVGAYPVKVREVNARGSVSYANSAPLVVLDSHRIERAIADAVRAKRHEKSTVTCPATILEAKGLRFTCTAKLKKGVGTFLVTETDAKGGVSFAGL